MPVKTRQASFFRNANSDGDGSSKLLVSAREAACLLSISERTLRDRTKDGTIPAIRLEGRVLYSPKALQAWIDRRIAHNLHGADHG